MGIPVLAGRIFAENDRERKVAVISERLADLLWPGGKAIGHSFEGGFGLYEVIGIVGDVRADAHKAPVPIFYHPYWDWPPLNSTIVARAVGDPRSIAATLRQAVASVDPDVPVPSLKTMQEVLDDSLSQRRFQAMLGTVFAGTALLLAALGIYGVVSCSVARRRNEIGIRAALGAQPSDLRWLVVRQGLAPVFIGLLGGILAALALGRVLGGLLFEIKPTIPPRLQSRRWSSSPLAPRPVCCLHAVPLRSMRSRRCGASNRRRSPHSRSTATAKPFALEPTVLKGTPAPFEPLTAASEQASGSSYVTLAVSFALGLGPRHVSSSG